LTSSLIICIYSMHFKSLFPAEKIFDVRGIGRCVK
jgi:hypothetical protein